MEDDDGYTNLDFSRRDTDRKPPPQQTKGLSSNLRWWKISLGVALAGIVTLIAVVIFLSLPSFWSLSERMEMISPHPVLLPAELCGSTNSNMLEPFDKVPKSNSCIPTDNASCLPNSEVCISLPKSIVAKVNQMALIPLEVEVSKSNWVSIVVLWHHIQGRPSDHILTFELRSCNPGSDPQPWWQRQCHVFVEVTPTHQWEKSVTVNACLVLWNVQEKDSGRYQVNVRSDNMKEACSFVELTVT
ncbi:hypothetical protein lerEdw1_011422 [Lerista edwardsae]|nr:hypothetical protein lerEdw1_011422 [Lerista edwardsae]